MKSIVRSLCVVVGIPTFIATIYFGVIASDVFVSEARFAIRSANGSTSSGGLAAILASPVIASGSSETMVVADYIHSQDMLNKIKERMDFSAHYTDPSIDKFSRLNKHATQEQMLEYFQHQVDVVRDTQSQVVTLRARAFDPHTAQQMADLLIELSEDLVNEMSRRIEVDALAIARDEVERATLKVSMASEELTRFRNARESINPAEESSAMLGIVSNLEAKLIVSRTELTEKLAYIREDSPIIVSLKNRVKALERQLSLERGRIVGGDGAQMSGLIQDYGPLALSQELAQRQYTSALTSLEVARLEAQRKKQYVVTFIEPGLPDDALEPRRFLEVLTVAILSFLSYTIGGLMWSALRDHIGK